MLQMIFLRIVALIQKTTGEYFCGGTIVSNNKIVTGKGLLLGVNFFKKFFKTYKS